MYDVCSCFYFIVNDPEIRLLLLMENGEARDFRRYRLRSNKVEKSEERIRPKGSKSK